MVSLIGRWQIWLGASKWRPLPLGVMLGPWLLWDTEAHVHWMWIYFITHGISGWYSLVHWPFLFPSLLLQHLPGCPWLIRRCIKAEGGGKGQGNSYWLWWAQCQLPGDIRLVIPVDTLGYVIRRIKGIDGIKVDNQSPWSGKFFWIIWAQYNHKSP